MECYTGLPLWIDTLPSGLLILWAAGLLIFLQIVRSARDIKMLDKAIL